MTYICPFYKCQSEMVCYVESRGVGGYFFVQLLLQHFWAIWESDIYLVNLKKLGGVSSSPPCPPSTMPLTLTTAKIHHIYRPWLPNGPILIFYFIKVVELWCTIQKCKCFINMCLSCFLPHDKFTHYFPKI